MKGSETQKQSPYELLWMLWFDGKSISNLLRANVCKPIACANAEQQEIKKGETILQDQTARGIFISDENRPESASFNNQGSMIGALLIKWEPLTTPI